MLTATGVQYVIAITGIVLLYIYYTVSDDCSLNKFFISFNLILCFLVSILSITPRVQESQPRSGLLQSSVVTLYTIYLTWSAVSNVSLLLFHCVIFILTNPFLKTESMAGVQSRPFGNHWRSGPQQSHIR